MKAIYAVFAVIVVVVAGFAGYMYYTNSQKTGNIALSVADAPANSSIGAVYITFSHVALHSNTSGWTNYSMPAKTVNIYDLTTTNASLLKNITLNAGTYTMIRLYITNVTVTVNGQNQSLSISGPYAFINHPFTVKAHATNDIIIDFNIHNDVHLADDTFTPDAGFVQN